MQQKRGISLTFEPANRSSEMELILVYNADSGFFNIVKDGLHKTISPSTYQCNLCALTYGTVRMKDEWKEFVTKLKIPAEFLHRARNILVPSWDPAIHACIIDQTPIPHLR